VKVSLRSIDRPAPRPPASPWLSPLLALLLWTGGPPVQSDAAIVRAVLFYSPTCPHCQMILTQFFPPLVQHYGDRLQVIAVDTTSPAGHQLFAAAAERFDIPLERQGVPLLIVDEVVLVGSIEIPEVFPGLIEESLARGGAEWPDIPGLSEIVASLPEPSTPAIDATVSPSPVMAGATSGMANSVVEAAAPASPPQLDGLAALAARLSLDPVGNLVAIVTLAGMVVVFVRAAGRLRRPLADTPADRRPWLFPLLLGVGLVAAGYLAFVEGSQSPAFCGPIGDCNAVQQSEYARLLGVGPIAVLGVGGYAVIGAVWAVGRRSTGRRAVVLWRAVVALALAGTLFSIVLTFLEPFVIGATCLWCIVSSLAMTGLMWKAVAWRPADGAALTSRRHPANG
jgi:uncharacterized membrane protein/thiol-disulfide isomerase/thioredoxin